MEAKLLKKVNNVLSKRLTDFESGLEYVKSTKRVLGFIISPDFKGSDHAKRQKLLNKALADKLSPDELLRVGPVVTMNPTEARMHDELGEAG